MHSEHVHTVGIPSQIVRRPLMRPYANFGGNSAVTAYELHGDSITVEFKGGATYLYTYLSAGSHHIEQMKALAQTGHGLGTYINKNVRKSYASRLA